MCTLTGPMIEDRAPKEGIVAYRVVRVEKDGRVTSVYEHCVPSKRSGKLFANMVPLKIGSRMKCKNLEPTIEKSPWSVDYPTKRNEVGFYAFSDLRGALTARAIVGYYRPGMSVARVRLFGRVVLHRNGYRAEYMKIEAIVCGRRPKGK